MKARNARQSPSSPPTPSKVPQRRLGIGEPFKNYLKIPNAYFKLVKLNKLSGSVQRDIVLLIMLHSWGDEDRSEYAALGLRSFSEECGGVSLGAISREIQDLIDRKLIEAKDAKGCGGLRLYKVTPESWQDAPPYTGRLDATTEAQSAPGESGKMLVIRPGRKPRCIPGRLLPPDREPVDFEIQCTNTGADAVQISSEVQGQIVRLTLFSETPKRRPKGEQSLPTEVQQKAKTVVNSRLTDLTVHIKKTLRTELNLSFDPTNVVDDHNFAVSILAAAGAELTGEYFAAYCSRQFAAMRKKRKPIAKGLLIAFAEQAAHEFRSVIPEEAPPPPLAPLPPPPPLDPTIAWDIVRKQLQAICSEITYSNWFARTRQISAGKASIVVTAPDEGTKEFLETDIDLKARISEACEYTQQPSKIIWRVE